MNSPPSPVRFGKLDTSRLVEEPNVCTRYGSAGRICDGSVERGRCYLGAYWNHL